MENLPDLLGDVVLAPDVALGVVAVLLLAQGQLVDLDFPLHVVDPVFEVPAVGEVTNDSIDVVQLSVHFVERIVEVAENDLVVRLVVCPAPPFLKLCLQIFVVGDLLVGEGHLVIESDLVELVTFGTLVVGIKHFLKSLIKVIDIFLLAG